MPESILGPAQSCRSKFSKSNLIRTTSLSATMILVVFCVAFGTAAQTPVLTHHNDNSRTGQNLNETILTTSNVNVSQFGKLFALPVDGQIYAQPLYVPGVTINGVTHNVVIVATENDSVYAFDADSNAGANSTYLWKASMVDAAHGANPNETALNEVSTINCTDLQPLIGITSTPVIDLSTNTIYLEAKSTDGTNYYHRLHSLDLLTGNEKSPGPTLIAAAVSGTGDGSSGGQIVFNSNTIALHQQSRAGLLLVNGTIFIAFASHCDYGPYHGWLFAYDEPTLTQKSVYVTTPNGGLGGFWMAGSGIAADASGNIFIASGNGDFDTVNVPATETADTILKLGTANQTLSLLDYFTPQDQASLQSADEDLGSGGVLLLPDQPGSTPHILVQAGKEGRIYVVNRDQMTTNNSHYCTGCTSDPEILEESASGAIGGLWGMPAYWGGNIYFGGSGDQGSSGPLVSIPIVNGLPNFSSTTSSANSFPFPGTTPSVSSSGTTSGTAIVWAIDSSRYGSPGPAVIHAYDATSLSSELWNSTQAAGSRDTAGIAVKFSVPTVSNGHVYVGSSTEVDVYGLLPNIVSLSSSSGPVGSAVTITGVNFGSSQGASTVAFNGITATVTNWSATSITTTVPSGATTGNVIVTVNGAVAGGVASNGLNFTVIATPAISNLSPASGPVGTAVTIAGNNFGPTQGGGTVTFDGTAATVTSWSNASIATSVPNSASSGNVVVTVNGVPSNGVSFTVTTGPAITSLNPTSGPVGTAVTLVGTNFGSSQGTSTVTFNGTSAGTATSWSATSITVAVPSGATTGNVIVTVGGVASNGVAFTVTSGGGGPTCPCTIWANTVTPSVANTNETHSVELGVKFTAAQNGYITGIRFYKGVNNTGTHVGNLWSSTGTLMASATFVGETSSGWQQMNFSTPVAVTANTVYVASYFTPTGDFSTDRNYFAASGVNNPPLQALENGVSGSNGVYNYGSSSSFPTGSYASSNYWVDVVFNTSTTAPVLTSLNPASEPVGTAVTIAGTNFGGTQGTSTVTFNGTSAGTATSWSATSITVGVPSGATTGNVVVTVGGVASNGVGFTVTASGSEPTLTSLNPTSGPVGTAVTITGTNFGGPQGTSTVTFNGTSAGTATSWSATSITVAVPSGATTGNVIVTVGGVASNGVAFTVTSGGGGPTCPCTIWATTATPGTSDSHQTQSVELGVKFTAAESGYITGIRFYKGVNNTGTHVGNLWSSTGTILASATFVGETSSGWQQVNFSTPVAVTANTVYVASYFTPTGDFSTDRNYFAASGVNNPPLQALENGVSGSNGVYGYGSSSSFPTGSYASSNYWVDVVFNTSTTAPALTSLNPASGPVGTAVTIAGTNFGATQGTSTVTFNGTSAGTATSWSATSISATVPGGATSGNIIVTVNGSSSNGVAFAVSRGSSGGQLMTLSSNGKYLVNGATNQPIFVVGDDAFDLCCMLSASDVSTYLNDRAGKGFNAIWMAAVDNGYSSNPPANSNANVPFDGADFTNFDPNYWANIDSIITQTSNLGITVFLNPFFPGSGKEPGYLNSALSASDATMSAYGTFLGNRYQGYNNIVWLLGGDSWPSSSGLYQKLNDVGAAIAASDPNHLITLEACVACATNGDNSVQAYQAQSLPVPGWLQLNWAYLQLSTTAASAQNAFNQSPFLPPVCGENSYELQGSMTPLNVRFEMYTEVLSGCYVGRIFGNGAIWSFDSPNGDSCCRAGSPAWQSQLSSPGSIAQQYQGLLFRSREHWLLVPDASHTVVTAGYGSGLTATTAAFTSDGQTIIAYIPNGNATTITVNMAKITSAASTVQAWWFNPQTAATTNIGTFPNTGTQTFTAPDSNDWILVLDDAAASLPAPGN